MAFGLVVYDYAYNEVTRAPRTAGVIRHIPFDCAAARCRPGFVHEFTNMIAKLRIVDIYDEACGIGWYVDSNPDRASNS